MNHYYIARIMPDGTTEYLNNKGHFKPALMSKQTLQTLAFTDANVALTLAQQHDALVLVTTDHGFQPI